MKKVKEKKCTSCGEIKLLTDYYKNGNSPDGHSYSCKKCTAKYNVEYRVKTDYKNKILINNAEWKELGDHPPETLSYRNDRECVIKSKRGVKAKSRIVSQRLCGSKPPEYIHYIDNINAAHWQEINKN